MTDPVREMLSWYRGENLGVLTNLARILNHGRLGGMGKVVILPVDQGFEHGPGRSFQSNPAAYDPRYFPQLAIEAGLNAYTAPLGLLEAGMADYIEQIPLILKLNNHDLLHEEKEPLGAQTALVSDALHLGCCGIGYTIYPGTAERRLQYEELKDLVRQVRAMGMITVVWSYPRGGSLSKEGETALDVVAYGARIAADLGAHIIKVKLLSAHIELEENQKPYERIPKEMLADRVRHVMQSVFNGRRSVLFSGGPKEAHVLTGIEVKDRATAHQAAEQLLQRGVSAVAIQAGEEGNLIVWQDGERFMPKLPVKSIDATGAGDAFVAALGVALAEGKSLADAGPFANAAAALKTTGLGAQVALPRREAIMKLLTSSQ